MFLQFLFTFLFQYDGRAAGAAVPPRVQRRRATRLGDPERRVVARLQPRRPAPPAPALLPPERAPARLVPGPGGLPLRRHGRVGVVRGERVVADPAAAAGVAGAHADRRPALDERALLQRTPLPAAPPGPHGPDGPGGQDGPPPAAPSRTPAPPPGTPAPPPAAAAARRGAEGAQGAEDPTPDERLHGLGQSRAQETSGREPGPAQC